MAEQIYGSEFVETLKQLKVSPGHPEYASMNVPTFTKAIISKHGDMLEQYGCKDISAASLQNLLYRKLPGHKERTAVTQKAYGKRVSKGVKVRYSESWFSAPVAQILSDADERYKQRTRVEPPKPTGVLKTDALAARKWAERLEQLAKQGDVEASKDSYLGSETEYAIKEYASNVLRSLRSKRVRNAAETRGNLVTTLGIIDNLKRLGVIKVPKKSETIYQELEVEETEALARIFVEKGSLLPENVGDPKLKEKIEKLGGNGISPWDRANAQVLVYAIENLGYGFVREEKSISEKRTVLRANVKGMTETEREKLGVERDAAEILNSMIRRKEWGAKNTSAENLTRNFPKDYRGQASEAIDYLIKGHFLSVKPKPGNLQVSLSREMMPEIFRIIRKWIPIASGYLTEAEKDLGEISTS